MKKYNPAAVAGFVICWLLAFLLGVAVGINIQLHDYLEELDKAERVIIEAQEAVPSEQV